MRRILMGGLLTLLALGAVAQGDRIPLAVVDFENRAADGGPELGAMCAEVLSDLLIQTRQFRVFDRSRVQEVIEEQSFQHMSGFVDTDQAVNFGRMLGVRFLVSGAILRTGVDVNEFTGYGVTTRTEEWSARVRLQVIDVETGETIYSQTGEGTQTIQGGSPSATRINTTVFEELLERILPPLADDLTVVMINEFSDVASAQPAPEPEASVTVSPPAHSTPVQAPATPAAPERVSLAIESVPDGAEVEIDGRFIGNAPIDVDVDPGVHEISLNLPGHQPWSREMEVIPGSRISATLTPTPGMFVSEQEPPVPTMAPIPPVEQTTAPTFVPGPAPGVTMPVNVVEENEPFALQPSTALRSDSDPDQDESESNLFVK
ncbi:PEGA domain-containing protein [Candidatus Sumerlaeota bacterium]|nr:PEGA domain-containing protein [Candidatus Sumerlaeota bacterium]